MDDLDLILAKLHAIYSQLDLIHHNCNDDVTDAVYGVSDYLAMTINLLADYQTKSEKQQLEPQEISLVAGWRSADQRAKESVANALRFTGFTYTPAAIEFKTGSERKN